MQKISGNQISKKIIDKLKTLTKPSRKMLVCMVGNDAISINFVNEKRKISEELGIEFSFREISNTRFEYEIRDRIEILTSDKDVGGVVIQLPLPQHLDRHNVLRNIPKSKDLDLLGSEAVADFYMRESGVLPPSVGALDAIVEDLGLDLSKMKVAVVGLGLLVGKPISIYLMHRAKELILIDKLGDVAEVSSADLVISGAGKAGLIKPEYIKSGAGVIDFGYDYSKGKLVGDFDHSDESKLSHLGFYTPTPGGTGPILVAKLFENFFKLNNE